jgi:translation initiation factor 5
MSVPFIAMDPQKVDDQFYRYKMPAIVTKVEGNGNGIKTVFPNIHEVCNTINRPESVMMKFFQFELGTQKTVSTKDDKFIVTGSRTQETMQEKVYSFITKFVLCKHCRNPETVVLVDAKDRVTLKCSACGKSSQVSSTERCTGLLATHYKNLKGPQKAATERPEQATTTTDAPATAPEAPRTVVEKPTGVDERENPAVILSRELANDAANLDSHVRLVYDLRSQYNLNDKTTVRLVLLAIIEANQDKFLGCVQSHAKLLARFALLKGQSRDQAVDEAAAAEAKKREWTLQEALITECERYTVSRNMAAKFPIMLKLLFDEGVLLQQSIEGWTPSSKTPKPVAEEIVKMMKPFLDWLSVE